MTSRNDIPAKRYLVFESRSEKLSAPGKIILALKGLCLFPFYLLFACFTGTPGLKPRLRCVSYGIRVLLRSRNFLQAYRLIVNPMDSVRYFEMDFAIDSIAGLNPDDYLDVSSPRLLPLLVSDDQPAINTLMINPVNSDLGESMSLATSMGIAGRIRFEQEKISDMRDLDESFDLVTCISVLEHIEDDSAAVGTMWNALRPGGKLIITTPVSRTALEEYSNIDEYNLLLPDSEGFVFWQRYYDESLLSKQIFSITGMPHRQAIYSEKHAGIYDANVKSKREEITYPFWKEPFFMGKNFQLVDSINQLSGMGVIAMEFIKAPMTHETS